MKKINIPEVIACVGILSVLITGCGQKNDKEAEPAMEVAKEENIGEETVKDSESASEESVKDEVIKEEREKEDVIREDNKREEKTSKDVSAEEAAPSVCGALHVEGSVLSDEQGRPVQLRGISTHGLQWFPEYVNEDCFKELHENWNANVIRLAMYTAEGGYCEGDKNTLKEVVKKGVEYATDQDMYVIVDWHILSDNNPNMHKDEAKGFFEEMAQTFADHNNVLYEICNEPNGNTTWSEIKAYAEEIIPVIRKYDKNAVILVGTPTWSQEADKAAADPITDHENIMYTLHFYAATHKEPLMNTMTAAIDAGLPVFVSEYGICDASGNGNIDMDSAEKWISSMNDYGVSYVAWNLSNKDEASAMIKSSCKKVSGFTEDDLSESGKWVCEMLNRDGGDGDLRQAAVLREKAAAQPQNESEVGLSKETAGIENTGDSSYIDGTDSLISGDTITLKKDDIDISVEYKGGWEADGKRCYQYNVALSNNSLVDIDGWTVEIPFNGDISLSQSWCGNFTVDGSVLEISPMDFNKEIAAGAKVTDIGFIIMGDGKLRIEQ